MLLGEAPTCDVHVRVHVCVVLFVCTRTSGRDEGLNP